MKATTGKKIPAIHIVNDMIVEELVAAKLGEEELLWHRPWIVYPRQNYVSHRPYNAVNRYLLGYDGAEYFITKTQVAQLKAKIIDDTPRYALCTFPKKRNLPNEDAPVSYWETKVCENGVWKALAFRHTTMSLYAVAQTDIPVPQKDAGFTPRTDVDEFISSLGYNIQEGGSTAAYDKPSNLIQVPTRDRFESATAYYHTLFRLIASATGASEVRRWRTENPPAENTQAGIRETLTVELASATLCLMFGFKEFARESAAYIDTWVKNIQQDEGLFTYASAQAERILKKFNLA